MINKINVEYGLFKDGIMHWTYRYLSEAFGLSLTMAVFAYTGALDPNIAAGMTCVAVSSFFIRKLFGA